MDIFKGLVLPLTAPTPLKKLINTYGDLWKYLCTLEFLINMQHVYSILTVFSFLHALIRNYTFINFQEIFRANEIFEYLW